MADFTSNTWKQVDANNNAPAPDGFPTGIEPSKVGGAIRAHRGADKRFFDRINPTVTSTGSASAYTITYEQAPPDYVKGERFAFWVHLANSGAATLSINGMPAKSLLSRDGKPLVAGDIVGAQAVECTYDGTAFRLMHTTGSNDGTIKTAAKGVVTSGTVTFDYNDGATQSITLDGAVTFSVVNLPALGATLQINIGYSSGSFTLTGTTWWELGNGSKSTSFIDTGMQFVGGRPYRLILENVAGLTTGVIQ